jgi:hypothetical protein
LRLSVLDSTWEIAIPALNQKVVRLFNSYIYLGLQNALEWRNISSEKRFALIQTEFLLRELKDDF